MPYKESPKYCLGILLLWQRCKNSLIFCKYSSIDTAVKQQRMDKKFLLVRWLDTSIKY